MPRSKFSQIFPFMTYSTPFSIQVECPSLAGEGMTSSTYYDGQKAYDDQTGRTQKYTCRLLIGIPNEGQYRVASKVIQIGRKIWSDLPGFQQNQGKTRLRGRGVGGIHESDEPLALCISCKDGTSFEQAVQFAEEQIRKLHADYIKFCRERGMPPPNLGRVRAICDHAHTTAPWRGGNPADRSFQEQLMHTQMTTPKGGKGMMGKGMMGGKGSFHTVLKTVVYVLKTNQKTIKRVFKSSLMLPTLKHEKVAALLPRAAAARAAWLAVTRPSTPRTEAPDRRMLPPRLKSSN